MSDSGALKIVVVGASAAGLRAASRARRLNPEARVVVLDQDTFISYGACGMPYFVSGDIERADKLRETAYGLIRDPEFFRTAKDIEVLTGVRVEQIDRDGRQVLCKDKNTGEDKAFPYDRLVLATGAAPIMLPGVAKDSKRITTFKTLHEAIHLRKSLETGRIGRVIIVGGGFIGCEMAEAFGSLWGAEVVMIEAAPLILPTLLDQEMAAAIEAYLREEGVELHTSCPVGGIEETDEGVKVSTPEGTFEADAAVVAVGVKPSSGLARDCGLTLGESGGIVVDEGMRTSDPDIYAAGDCVEVKHAISGKAFSIPLGSLANRQGRVVGCNLAGQEAQFGPVKGSAAVKVFDYNVASTGLTEHAAGQAGLDTACTWGTFTDKADYYPESQNIHLKLVYEKGTLRLLGLQAYGKGEVVKRVDVFAALLKKNGNLDDLIDAEFAYAPPYAPAVDPLFALGCAAKNAALEGIVALPPAADLSGRVVVDVRLPEEVEAGPFSEGAKNIPFEAVREKWEELPKDSPLLVVCSKGLRSSESVRILKEKGLGDVVYLGGGSFMRA
ncbi:MAG: FAD-dependent oxidoreductase [Planctomycetota bacterium]|jgi:NADPH-dependent 2,4-dienoyl-CoA reductase/sulfur reductase-like enzyme/rhodanese-related sulfurtransferase